MDQQYIYWKDSQRETKKYKNELSLPINFGKDINGNWVIRDLSAIENLLISGATGTGKTNFLDTVICSLGEMYSPEELKLVLIDCKLLHYDYIKLPHLLYPITGDVDEALNILRNSLAEIKARKNNSIDEPKILIVIDEVSDIMLNEEEAEAVINQIAKEGAQVGVHILLASSRSMPKVFTSKIKSIISTRLAGAMATELESVNLLDRKGAEELEGSGEMLYKDKTESIRVQTPFISYEEQKEMLNKLSQSTNEFYPEIDKEDELYKEALKLIEEHDPISHQILCDNLNIDYYRANQILAMVVDDNDKREGLYEDVLKLYEKDNSINAVGVSKKLKIHYDRAKELIDTVKKNN